MAGCVPCLYAAATAGGTAIVTAAARHSGAGLIVTAREDDDTWWGGGQAIKEVQITAHPDTLLGTFEPSFASITFDIQNFIGFKIYAWSYNWRDPQLRTMISALAPMTVRCGGTWEDGILWEGGPQTGLFATKMPPHNLTVKEWTPFVEVLSGIDGVELLVGLNSLLRRWGGCHVPPTKVCQNAIPWDPSNAISFIKHNHEQGYRIFGCNRPLLTALVTFVDHRLLNYSRGSRMSHVGR